jgi:hypothetical protein
MHLHNCYPDIRSSNGPFNPDNFGGTYFRRVRDIESLDDTLEEIWSSFNGIKHVWHASGWPFTQRHQFNQHLLLKAGSRVLLLNRRNTLRRVVSSQISEQTKVWGIPDERDCDKVPSFKFKPLDVEWLTWQLQFEREAIAEQKSLLNSSGVAHLELWYEDLYQMTPSWRHHLDKVDEIISFLGGSVVTDEATLVKMRELLDPRNTKLNSKATYQRIPGIEEIEATFGSGQGSNYANRIL